MEGEGSLLIPKDRRSTLTTEIQLESGVDAPVRQGQRLGTLTVRAREEVLKQIPLVAGETVERLTFGEIFCRVLGRAAMAKNA